MKKLLLILVLLIPTTLFAGEPAVSYYDLQHFKIVPDTNTNRNDWYMRGSFHLVKSTWVVDAATIAPVFSFNDDGTVSANIIVSASTTTLLSVYTGAVLQGEIDTVGNDLRLTAVNNAIQLRPADTTVVIITDSSMMINVPLVADSYIQFRALTTASLQGLTPSVIGQAYWNSDNDELWISTGTAINQFVHIATSLGDMSKSVYDTEDNGVVDNSEALNGEAYAHFVTTNTNQTIGGDKVFSNYILISSQPCTKAYLGSKQSNISNQTWTQVLLDTENFDIGSNFDVGTSSYIVPITGYYQIDAAVEWDGDDMVADKRFVGAVRSEAIAILASSQQSSSVGWQLTNNMSGTVYLIAGQSVTLWVYQDSGSNNLDINDKTEKTYLSIRLTQ